LLFNNLTNLEFVKLFEILGWFLFIIILAIGIEYLWPEKDKDIGED